MMLVRSKEEVCRERAALAADEKFDPIILSKRKEYSATRNVKIMQEIIKLSRKKTKFAEKAYQYHFDNYEKASDIISKKVPEKVRKSYNLKEFSNYLTDALKDI